MERKQMSKRIMWISAAAALLLLTAESAGVSASALDYNTYYDTYSGENTPSGFIGIRMESALPGGETDTVDGMPAMILRAGGTGGAWEFTVEQTGVYGIPCDIIRCRGTARDILVSVTLNGKTPHDASGDLTQKSQQIPLAIFPHTGQTANDNEKFQRGIVRIFHCKPPAAMV